MANTGDSIGGVEPVAPHPVQLRQMGPGSLGIVWSDAHHSLLGVRRLRLECRCSLCVDEWTRERTLREEAVPQDVRPRKIEPVGKYAFRIDWSDGHTTGIYTFEALRRLCECPQCKKA